MFNGNFLMALYKPNLPWQNTFLGINMIPTTPISTVGKWKSLKIHQNCLSKGKNSGGDWMIVALQILVLMPRHSIMVCMVLKQTVILTLVTFVKKKISILSCQCASITENLPTTVLQTYSNWNSLQFSSIVDCYSICTSHF